MHKLIAPPWMLSLFLIARGADYVFIDFYLLSSVNIVSFTLFFFSVNISMDQKSFIWIFCEIYDWLFIKTPQAFHGSAHLDDPVKNHKCVIHGFALEGLFASVQRECTIKRYWNPLTVVVYREWHWFFCAVEMKGGMIFCCGFTLTSSWLMCVFCF